MRPTLLILTAAALLIASAHHPPGAAAAPCDKWASTSPGSADSEAPGSGSEAQPYRSVSFLLSHLAAGQTGCLISGQTFNEPLGTFIVANAGGTAAAPVTVRSSNTAGPRAVIQAQAWLQGTTHDIVFEDLKFGPLSPAGDLGSMLIVHGDRITFRNNEITYPRGICLFAGLINGYRVDGWVDTDGNGQVDTPPRRAQQLTLRGNRIHDCGTDIAAQIASPDHSGVHGVYLGYTGNAVIRDNYIYDNIDRGIQLWPDNDDALIANNVLDGNGSNLHVSSESAFQHITTGTVVRDNLITFSDLRALTDPNWPEGDTDQIVGYGFPGPARNPGEGDTYGNAVTSNCLYQPAPNANHNFSGWGYSLSGNVIADPLYVDRANHDYRLGADSPCRTDGPQPVTCATVTASSAGVTSGAGPNGSVVHTGSAGPDVIVGTAGFDVLRGLGGNDLLCGRAGYDELAGGAGDDTLDGEAGEDAAEYTDAPGPITVTLGIRVPQNTGEGADTLLRMEDVYGSAFADRLTGSGSAVQELLFGANGNDVLKGGAGPDVLGGGEGSDSLEGGAGADALHGHAGRDTATYSGRTAVVAVDIDGVADDGAAGEGDNVMGDVEDLVGGKLGDTLVGSALANTLAGGPGSDVLKGLAGADTIKSRDGVDDGVIECGADADTLIADALPADDLGAGAACETIRR